MHLKIVGIGFLLIFSISASSMAKNKIETQIGPFNLSALPVTGATLISEFGQGFVCTVKAGNKVLGKGHNYYVPGQNLWIAIGLSHVLDENLERVIEEILVTKEKLCDKKYKPKSKLSPLVTSRGIKIGDSVDKVIDIYGKPTISISVGKEKIFSILEEDLKLQKGLVLRYLTDQPNELNFAEFYFDEEGLHSMLVSESE